MYSALCSNGYNETTAPLKSERGCCDITWDSLLPHAWRTQVVVPVEFDVFREYEIAAERTVGRDADGLPCFHAYRYILHELRSDDEDYYLTAVYGETLTAWRRHDGRWLSYRLASGEGDTAHGFYTLGEKVPLR